MVLSVPSLPFYSNLASKYHSLKYNDVFACNYSIFANFCRIYHKMFLPRVNNLYLLSIITFNSTLTAP